MTLRPGRATYWHDGRRVGLFLGRVMCQVIPTYSLGSRLFPFYYRPHLFVSVFPFIPLPVPLSTVPLPFPFSVKKYGTGHG